jgi:hypothetical protein
MTSSRTLAAALLATGATFLGMGSVHAAQTAEQRCQGARNQLAAKYAVCRAKAEAKFTATADVEAYDASITKCSQSFTAGWTKIEAKAIAAGGACTDVVADDALRDFIAAFSSVIADVVGGGDLPPDVSMCLDDLAGCEGDLSTCQSGLATSASDLATCQSGLATSAGNLATCQGSLATSESSLATCQADLAAAADCLDDLATCEQDLQCGNGAIDGSEDCDAAMLGGATCSSATGGTLTYGTLGCTGDCQLDTSACHAAICGNGAIEGAEVCDTAALGGATCSSATGGARPDGLLSCDSSCALDTECCATPGQEPGFRNLPQTIVLDSVSQLLAQTGPPDDTLWTFEVRSSLNHGDYDPVTRQPVGEPTIFDLSNFVDPLTCGTDSMTFAWELIDNSGNYIRPRGMLDVDTPVLRLAANSLPNGWYTFELTVTRPSDGYVMLFDNIMEVTNSGVSQLIGDSCAQHTEPTSQCGFLASLMWEP